MDQFAEIPAPIAEPPAQGPAPAEPRTEADAVMTAYVGFLAGCFDIGRLAAGRRLSRAGVRDPLLNDA